MHRFLAMGWLWVWLAAGAAPAPTIVVVGDSLSAAYGIPLEQGWVQHLQQRLEQEGYPHRVVNGSVSGETTAGGLARLPGLLERQKPQIVMVELGGNDGLRGLSLEELQGNLVAMVRQSREAGAHSMLFEMRIPPNYGATYTEGFQASFRDVADREDATFVPFFLTALVEREDLFQEDGIHPTSEAQPLMLDAVWPHLKPLLKARTASR